jgi:hypothetical protein
MAIKDQPSKDDSNQGEIIPPITIKITEVYLTKKGHE